MSKCTYKELARYECFYHGCEIFRKCSNHASYAHGDKKYLHKVIHENTIVYKVHETIKTLKAAKAIELQLGDNFLIRVMNSFQHGILTEYGPMLIRDDKYIQLSDNDDVFILYE